MHPKGKHPQSPTFPPGAFATRSVLPLTLSLPPVQIYHPNLDLEGNVCLNILREDWKPVLNLNAVMVGLQYLFLEPNADDPLNKGKHHPAHPAHPAPPSRCPHRLGTF